jgi:hypothetical protein
MPYNMSVEESRRVLGLSDHTEAVDIMEHDGISSEKQGA